MNRIIKVVLAFLLGFVLAGGIVAAQTPSAEARPKISRIYNNLSKKGSNPTWIVVVRCSYNDPAKKWKRMKPGESSLNKKHCGVNDVDQALSSRGNTCVAVANPIPKGKKNPVKNGVYRMHTAKWYKFVDYSISTVFTCKTAKDKKAKEYPLT